MCLLLKIESPRMSMILWCLLLKIDTAKKRKSSYVHDIILIEFDFPQGIRIRNQNRHAIPGDHPVKNRKSFECP
jgi:hypothetical protein